MNQLQQVLREESKALQKRVSLYDSAAYQLDSGMCGDDTQSINFEFDCVHLFDSFGDAKATIRNILHRGGISL